MNHAYGDDTDFQTVRNDLDSLSIPLMNITTDMDSVNIDDYVHATIEIVDYQRRNSNGQQYVKYNCLLKYRGASSVSHKKKSFAFKLVDSNDDKLEANLLNLRKESTWILDAMAIDRIRMRNRVCFDLWNEMNRLPYETKYDQRSGTVGLFVEVFINGEYYGLYCLTDRINRELLGLKKTEDKNGQVNVKGVLYQGINWKTGYNLRSYNQEPMDSTVWNSFELDYPEEYPSKQAWLPLANLIDFCSDTTGQYYFLNNWEDHFYKENLIHYHVFTVALFVGDNLYKNTYLANPDVSEQSRFIIIPWDMDYSLGGYWTGQRQDTYAQVNRYDNIAPYNRLYSNNLDGFCQDIKDYWLSVSQNELSIEHVFSILDRYADQFEKSGAWKREYDKWNNSPVPLKQSLNDEINYVKNWYRHNYVQFCTQLDIQVDLVPQIQSNHSDQIYDMRGLPLNDKPQGLYIQNNKVYYYSE